MNAFQKKVLYECIGDAHTLLYEKNKGLIRVGKVMNALYEKNKELIALYEKNKGLIGLYEKNKGLIREGKESHECII